MRILLADRSPHYMERLIRLLEDMPGVAAVAQATTLSEVRSLLTIAPPDVVVVDPSIGEGSGLKLLREIKAVDPHPYTIVLTNDPSPTFTDRCMRAADLCLDKAGDMEVLVETLIRQRAKSNGIESNSASCMPVHIPGAPSNDPSM